MNFFKVFLLFSSLVVNVASARDLQAKFQDWSFFRTNRGDKIICYVMSIPIKSTGNTRLKRGDSFLTVTNIENDADELSVSSGVNYHDKSDVDLSFGARKYSLFPDKSRAWTYDKDDDIDIVKQMQQNSDVIVSGSSVFNENVSDTYSLIGFTQAYNQMKKICKN